MMVVVMGCNSGGVAGGEEGKNKFLQSLVKVSNEFLNVFTSFGEMVGSVLGLNVNSKKSDVGKYFKTVEGTVQGIKDGLNKIVAEMKAEKNLNAEATDTAVKTLVENTLDKIIAGAKTVGDAVGITGDELIGSVAADNAGGTAGDKVKKIVEGIKVIVEVVLKGVGKADAGDSNKASDGKTARTANGGNDEAGKLFDDAAAFNSVDNAKKAVADALKAIGAVTGADILKAISKGNNIVDAKLASAKDGTIAGAIALRAMAKGGKFAGPSAAAAEYNTGVKNTVVSAVNKALNTLTIAIRKTVDEGLKTVKESIKFNTESEKTVVSPNNK
ncbi:Vlp protein, gamma subfamily (plasmid) [Borrelia crocidurae str. Achema]|uniref:Variable large protein n=1 Tax=Borrelia crocidurae (strain Achema) TaxID=1155096 RepID=I0FF08_BORCA|nr:Vlp protein, gamma subfamily [Borrelia crocidurae str. Achema]